MPTLGATAWERLRNVRRVPRRAGPRLIDRIAPWPGFRGFTWRGVGLVVVLCVGLTLRQVATLFADADTRVCGDCSFATFDFVRTARFTVRHLLAALPMLFLVILADDLSRRWNRGRRIAALVAAVIVGSVAFAVVFDLMATELARANMSGQRPANLLAFFARAAFYGGMATAALYLLHHERDEWRLLHDVSLSSSALERQMIEARLQALQAQIEPHFLFNTLANIKLLYDVDPGRARPLLRSLTDYLAAALPRMRERRSTLGRELAMVEAYLEVVKVRMGDRLVVVHDVPAALDGAAVPPMMLLTLVENAVKHGLDPHPEGGTIRIRAELAAGKLVIAVDDDGAGFAKSRGPGVGLANIRARLAVLYGTAANLRLESNGEGGVSATIVLPAAANPGRGR